MQQQQHLQQLVAVQQLQRQQQHKQHIKQQQAVKPPQIGVDFSKVAPDVLEGFVNVCPTCGIHSFFSPISLELHKNICAKVLQHEWISYSKVGYTVQFCLFVCIELYWSQVAWTTRLEFSLCTRKAYFQISMLTSTRLILPTDQKTDEPETSASPTLHKSISERSLSSPIENHQSTSTSTPSFEQLGVYQNFGQNLLGKTPRSVCHICNKKFRNSLQLEIHVKKVSLSVVWRHCFPRNTIIGIFIHEYIIDTWR